MVNSEMKIIDKIKLGLNIVPFTFFFSKRFSFPSDNNSGHKISLSGPALSLPGTRIIASKDLHYCFQGPALLLPGPVLLLQGSALLISEPVLLLQGPALLLLGPTLGSVQVLYKQVFPNSGPPP